MYYYFIKLTIGLISFIREGLTYAMGLGMIIWMAAPSQAASDDVSVLTLNAAVIQALTHNQDLMMAENQVLSSEVSLAKEQHDFLPEVGADTTLGLDYDADASGSDQYYDTFTASAKATYNLYNGNQDRASLKAARHTLAANQKGLIPETQKIIFETVNAYLDAVKSMEQIQVAEKNLEDNLLQLEEIKAYYKAGARPITDVYQQQAETAKARLSLIEARRGYDVCKMKLLQTIGLPATQAVAVAAPDPTSLNIDLETDTVKLITSAMDTRPDLIASKSNVATTDAQIIEARAGNLPTVDLFASVGSSNGGRGPN